MLPCERHADSPKYGLRLVCQFKRPITHHWCWARIQEMKADKDVLTIGEQLSSSVDVHIGVNTAIMLGFGFNCFWSGLWSIEQHWARKLSSISLQAQKQSFQEMTGNPSIQFPFLWGAGNARTGYGKGQRIIRISDGTTHIFMVKRSLKANSGNNPVLNHMKKTPNGDLFWNKRQYHE